MYMKGEHQKWRPDCLRAAKLLLFVGPPPGLMDAPLYFFCFYISSIMMIVMMTMISPKIVMMMLIVKAMIRSTMMVFSPPRPHQGWLRHFAICCTVCNLSSPEISNGLCMIRVAKCQFFYTEQNLRTKFYPKKNA